MIERIHLQIIYALAEKGTLTRVAEELCLSQSALSHQIRALEKRLGTRLWERGGKRLHLTPAGETLLLLAKQLLPALEQAEVRLRSYANGSLGSLDVGVECYPCHAWLVRVTARFMDAWSNVHLDIVNRFQFDGVHALKHLHLDLLITPDRIDDPQLHYEKLFEYELVLLMSRDHALAKNACIAPEMLKSERLVTFPVPIERLDVFADFLIPAACSPAAHERLASMEVMLQRVARGWGVCALPKWLAEEYAQDMPIAHRRLGNGGIHKCLYACTRKGHQGNNPLYQVFIDIAKGERP